MGKINYFLLLAFALYTSAGYAQQGKNGALTVSSANTVVNEYTSLKADAASGSTSISVNSSSLDHNNRFTGPLAHGDLILIIQMQGATINGTATDSTWGTVTNYNNCGLYEFSEVAAVPDTTTINLSCSLKNNYTANGKVQIVRVPRYSSLTVDSGAVLTCDAWDGTKGGIVAVEVQGNTVINGGGVIDASTKGYRGGALQNASYTNNITLFATTNPGYGAQKGEGIAGYQADYNVYGGMFGRGAPANGGGGGNSTNTPGGGGGNAGNINAYTGNGNPDTTNANWITAWNLEYNGFAYSTSSGGGRGGYAWANGYVNPLTVPPGNPSWTGDSRNNHGGKGGRPLDYSTGRIFFGGGGGAGHENDNDGGSGGNGGGIVFIICYGTISGTGSITSNGANGQDAYSPYSSGDGSGGAGAGGTVLLSATGAISGISVAANGGIGGNQVIGSSESEGPGGGGGGGYIAISNGSINRQALGGSNGTTNSAPLANFPPNGATKGGDGLANDTINGIVFSFLAVQVTGDTSICSGIATPLLATGGVTYAWSPVTGLSCDTCPNPVASPVTTTTYIVTVSSGSCSGTGSAMVTVLGASGHAGTITAPYDTICQYMDDTIVLSGNSGAFQWQSSVNLFNFTDIQATDSVMYLDSVPQTVYFRVYTGSGTCGDTSQPFKLVVNPLPAPPNLTASDSIICAGDSARVCATSGFSLYQWNTGQTVNCIEVEDAGNYYVTVTDNHNCTAQSSHLPIRVYPVPSVSVVEEGKVLSSFGQSGYQWYLNGQPVDTATGPVYETNGQGTYWVEVTDSNGCTAISTALALTGMEELSDETSVVLYPNPCLAASVQLSVSNELVGSELEVYDDEGRMIFNSEIRNPQSEITVTGLPGGVYYLLISNVNTSITKKLVKL